MDQNSVAVGKQQALDDQERLYKGATNFAKKLVLTKSVEEEDPFKVGLRRAASAAAAPASRTAGSVSATGRTAASGRTGRGTRRAAASQASPAGRRRGNNTGGRPRNPFIEYEDREVRLQRERRWLEQDSVYMNQRRQGMRHERAMGRMLTRTTSESELYENRTMFGNYSVQLRQSRSRSAGGNTFSSVANKVQPQVTNAQGPGKKKQEEHSALKTMKKLTKRLADSMKECEEGLKQRGLNAELTQKLDGRDNRFNRQATPPLSPVPTSSPQTSPGRHPEVFGQPGGAASGGGPTASPVGAAHRAASASGRRRDAAPAR